MSGKKFEAELSSHMVRVGSAEERSVSPFKENELWPQFRTRLTGLWEADADMSNSMGY